MFSEKIFSRTINENNIRPSIKKYLFVFFYLLNYIVDFIVHRF